MTANLKPATPERITMSVNWQTMFDAEHAMNARLSAENARLREALAAIVDRNITYTDDSAIIKISGFHAALDTIRTARAALKVSP